MNVHNNLVDMVTSRGLSSTYQCWLPEAPVEIDLKGFSQSDAILWNESDDISVDYLFLSIMRSRVHLTTKNPTIAFCHVGQILQFDMDNLEGDVVRYFIAGKPHLISAEMTIRQPFRFRNLENISNTPGTG